MNTRPINFILLSLTVWLALSAVESIFGARLPIKTYTSADGLGSSFIDFIYRDSRGFMWFCTRDGLSRFDGSRFINYRVGDKNSAPGIETISETSDGYYWISTTGGLYRFHPSQVSTPDSSTPTIDAEYVSKWRGYVFQDSRDNIWLASGRLFQWQNTDGKGEFNEVDWKIPPKPNVTLTTYQMLETDDGSLWLATSWGVVRRLPDGRSVVYRHDAFFTGGSSGISMTLDKSGRLWIIRHNFIFVLKPEPADVLPTGETTIEREIVPSSVIDLKIGETVDLPKISGVFFHLTLPEEATTIANLRSFLSSDGSIWIVAGNNLLEINNSVLRIHRESEGLPGAMGRLGEDAAGNLWIGGHSVLARLDRRGLVTYSVGEGAATSRFFAINEGADGTLYFANGDSVITKFDGTKLQKAQPIIDPNPIQLWTSRFTFIDSKNNWWFLTAGKLYFYSGVKDFAELNGRRPTKVFTTADGLPSNGMFQIFEDASGDIWVSTRGVSSQNHGLARLRNGADKFESFGESDGFPPRKSPSAFAEDRFGNLWLAFYEGGLARFDGERFEHFPPGDSLPEGLLSDLHLDQKGRLWIASTVGGVLRIDDPSVKVPSYKHFTIENGLTSNNVRTITEDNFGKIYLGTARGVDCLSPDTGYVKHYTVDDGLAADFVVDSHRDRQGNLWFATNNGVSKLVPRPDEKLLPPRIFIGGLRIAGVEQSVAELGSPEILRGELSHSENNLQIEFFGLDLRAGETLRYQYKLEGADADWSAPTDQRNVTFANLSAGSYRFLVRAVTGEGIASETPAIVSFKILPPIWARWWFIALSVLAVALIVTAFFRYRLARLREINAALEEARRAEESLRKSKEERLAELEQVRSRIATDLHDDIGASLTQIAILSEVAQAQSKNGASEPLKLISNVSNELVGTMSDIVWSINPQKDHFSDLTQRMRRFASDVLTAKNIALQFHAAHEADAMTVNSNVRREVFLIFKEAVNNIVKHASAEKVEITVKLENDLLQVEIADDGKGFEVSPNPLSEIPNSQSDGGNGLPSMRKRAAEMNGKVEILSTRGRGTTVKLSLPLEVPAQTGGEILN